MLVARHDDDDDDDDDIKNWALGEWPGRPGFNPRLSHTKDSKNGT